MMALMPFNRTITRRVRTAPTFDATTGLAVEGTTTDEAIKASVQPASGQDVQFLPEGRREVEAYKIYTTTKLNTTDRIVFAGALYQIEREGVYQSGIVPHYKYLMQKVLT